MTRPEHDDAAAAPRRLLDALLARGTAPTEAELTALAAVPAAALDQAVRGFARDHGAAGATVLVALAEAPGDRAVRRTARRGLYRLAQRGVPLPGPTTAARPLVERPVERATSAWLSSIDGTGSRAAWILFEGAPGGRSLCSLVLNDQAGVLEAAGGDISRKRLERELAALRASEGLQWAGAGPEHAVGLVVEALALHRALGTAPPAGFERWRARFESAARPGTPAPPAEPDPALVERAAELFELRELGSWCLDPERVQADAVELLQARESRLVLSDQLRAEREASIVARVVERELSPEVRALWARRLVETALVLEATNRPEAGAMARAAAGALADVTREARHQPFARALAERALALAGEVALGRVSAAQASRRPVPVTGPAPMAPA